MRAIRLFQRFHGCHDTWSRGPRLECAAAIVPPLLVQPVAPSDVGRALPEMAVGRPQGRATDLAGAEPQDLVDMARRTLAARDETIRLVPS